jgi:hypothetical protein
MAWATETFTTERQADAFLATAHAVRAAPRRR